ncbi:MAG: hypothetical protein R6X14_05720 [bacterium]
MPLYPFLFGLFPVLALYAHNSDQLTPDSLVVPCVLALAVAAVALFVLRWPCGNFQRSGMASGLFVVLFFGYGHVHTLFSRSGPRQVVLAGAALLVIAMAAMVFAVVLISRCRRGWLPPATKALNAIAAVMLLVPAFRIALFEFRAPGQEQVRAILSAGVPVSAGDEAGYPNILYLVPDRYPGESTLVELYGYDNSEFLDALRERGFYVAGESRCNFGRTDMSLASALNMSYLDSLFVRFGRRGVRRAFYWAIQDNEVARQLRARGYRHLHFGTWWHTTSHGRRADGSYNRLSVSEFVMMLYRMTMVYPAGAALGLNQHSEQWKRVHYKFDLLETLDSVPGPVFVFAHFLVPHEPYVLGRNGDFVSRLEQFRRGTTVGFSDQVTYVNQRLLVLVDRLTGAEAVRPWVIVIQSDEGPHPPHNFEHRDSLQTLRAKFRILNAYYLPGVDSAVLYSDISPVNTFRVVFDSYFGFRYGLLPDRSLLVRDGGPCDVTEQVRYRSAVLP